MPSAQVTLTYFPPLFSFLCISYNLSYGLTYGFSAVFICLRLSQVSEINALAINLPPSHIFLTSFSQILETNYIERLSQDPDIQEVNIKQCCLLTNRRVGSRRCGCRITSVLFCFWSWQKRDHSLSLIISRLLKMRSLQFFNPLFINTPWNQRSCVAFSLSLSFETILMLVTKYILAAFD